MRNFLLTILVLGLLVSPLANAARAFPAKVVGGTLTPLKYPYVKIGKDTFRFSPGGKIYDQSNRIIFPVTLTSTVKVAYLIDIGGELSKVWILTDEEIKAFPKPKTDEAKKPAQNKTEPNPTTHG